MALGPLRIAPEPFRILRDSPEKRIGHAAAPENDGEFSTSGAMLL